MKLEDILSNSKETQGEKPKDMLGAILDDVGGADMPAIADPAFFNRDTDLRKLEPQETRPPATTNLDLENPAPVEPTGALAPFKGGDSLAQALGPDIDTLGRLGIEAGTSEEEIRTLLRKVLRKL
jgi:hypothetical protein